MFAFTYKGKQECWALDNIYNGIPVLPPQLNVIIDNGNYFTIISNAIYPFNNGRECEECQAAINNDEPTTKNFLVSIIKEQTTILEINPPFYFYDNTYSFPITVSTPLAGVHNGLVNQAVQIVVNALVPNKSHCISLMVNNSVLMSQTLTVTTIGIYPVEFLGVNVSSSDILEIEIYPGVC